MDIYLHDDSFRRKGLPVIAGIDEAGRGPIAGPVVAAAVILPAELRIEGLRDSKIVPEKERALLFWEILVTALDIGVGMIDNVEIDRIDILRATMTAMRYAVEDLTTIPDALIVDAVTIPVTTIKQFSIVKADAKSAAVAAASIVAKYVRDKIMVHFDEIYPQYNFKKHKGYCTKEHMDKISRHGPCALHRKSFKQVMTTELPFPLS